MSDARVIGAVDLGSNTIKFTVAACHPDGAIEELDRGTETVRIGAGIEQTGQLEPGRIDRTVEALQGFEVIARRHGAQELTGVATEALRVASNGGDLLDRVAAETGWDLRVIAGEEEARLTFVGLRHHLPMHGNAVIVDIGGGSTEWVEASDRRAGAMQSIPLGSGRLADRFLSSNPPTIEMLAAARTAAAGILARALGANDRDCGVLFLSGGNGTYLEALRAHVGAGSELDAAAIDVVVQAATRLTAEDIARILDMQLERARVLPAGIAIAAAVADYMHPVRIETVPSGIVTGILREAAERHFAAC